jgi:hypothetical protein
MRPSPLDRIDKQTSAQAAASKNFFHPGTQPGSQSFGALPARAEAALAEAAAALGAEVAARAERQRAAKVARLKQQAQEIRGKWNEARNRLFADPAGMDAIEAACRRRLTAAEEAAQAAQATRAAAEKAAACLAEAKEAERAWRRG